LIGILGRRRLAALATVAALAVTLGGSDGSDPDPSPSTTPTIKIAGSVGSLPSYCEIQGLRQMIGDVDASALPDWADKTEVDGTPLIVDFKKEPAESHAAT
jgi:hypothetical protein